MRECLIIKECHLLITMFSNYNANVNLYACLYKLMENSQSKKLQILQEQKLEKFFSRMLATKKKFKEVFTPT